jgi:hypothetical protein
MITQNSNTEISETVNSTQDSSYNLFIEILDGLDLPLQIALMTHLIGGLDMDEDQIKLAKSEKGLFSLAEVVRICVSGGTNDREDLQAGIDTNPVQEIH